MWSCTSYNNWNYPSERSNCKTSSLSILWTVSRLKGCSKCHIVRRRRKFILGQSSNDHKSRNNNQNELQFGMWKHLYSLHNYVEWVAWSFTDYLQSYKQNIILGSKCFYLKSNNLNLHDIWHGWFLYNNVKVLQVASKLNKIMRYSILFLFN